SRNRAETSGSSSMTRASGKRSSCGTASGRGAGAVPSSTRSRYRRSGAFWRPGWLCDRSRDLPRLASQRLADLAELVRRQPVAEAARRLDLYVPDLGPPHLFPQSPHVHVDEPSAVAAIAVVPHSQEQLL